MRALEQIFEQLRHVSCLRNDGIRRDLVERDQDKSALCQARMRNLQARLADFKVTEEQNVEVQSPGSVADAYSAVPAKLFFDGQQAAQQLFRLDLSLQTDNGIYKAGLRGKPDWIRRVQRRPADQASQGFQAQGRGGQSSFRVSGPTS